MVKSHTLLWANSKTNVTFRLNDLTHVEVSHFLCAKYKQSKNNREREINFGNQIPVPARRDGRASGTKFYIDRELGGKREPTFQTLREPGGNREPNFYTGRESGGNREPNFDN